MVVKILYTKGPNSNFPAITYNTGKMDRNKGELMKVANFGALQALGQLRPQDYKNYLKMISAVNKSVTKPQFHVAISGEGRSYSKDELMEIATQWMERMGYGQQPYLIIYHKDTANNHVHIVSTRIGKDGKKIRDSYEQIRGHQQMNIVMGIDEKQNARTDIEKVLAYQFATPAQFRLILESNGYVLKEQEGHLDVIKFGRKQEEVAIKLIDEQLSKYQPDLKRKTQLKAMFYKYAAQYSTELVKERGKYSSAFSAGLKDKFGIDLVFHASGDKPPYGYTVIDHTGKQVFKGGEIMPLKELLAIPQNINEIDQVIELPMSDEVPNEAQVTYYAAILKAALHNYPDLIQGLQHQGLLISRNGETFTLHDPGNGVSIDTADLLNNNDYRLMVEHFSQSAEVSEEVYRQHHHFQGINLASDIDDEAIHGRNRRRKQTARTNSR
jgi:hypothetical protein